MLPWGWARLLLHACACTPALPGMLRGSPAAEPVQGRTPVQCVLAGLETSFMDCAVLQSPSAAPWEPELLQEVCNVPCRLLPHSKVA